MSPMWDNEPEYGAGYCAACGLHTDKGIVRWLPRMSGADVRLILHADPDECAPAGPVEPLRLAPCNAIP